jgi:hypothetical protein
LVFDEGICSFTWDAFEIPTRNGHVTQIILNFTPESFRELGFEKYHKLRTELKDAIMDYVPLFTQVFVAYDTTKCDDQLNESEHKQPKYLKVIESILEPFKDKDCVCDIKAKYKEEDDYYFVNIIVSNKDLDDKFPTNPQIRYYLGKLKREVSNYLHEYLPITFFVEIEDTPNCAGYNEYRNKLNESEDTVREFGNAKHLTIHDAEYDPLAYYEGNKLEKYEKEKAEYLELLKQKSSSSDAYKTYVKSTLNSIKKEQEELKSPFIFNPEIKGGKKKSRKRSKKPKKSRKRKSKN